MLMSPISLLGLFSDFRRWVFYFGELDFFHLITYFFGGRCRGLAESEAELDKLVFRGLYLLLTVFFGFKIVVHSRDSTITHKSLLTCLWCLFGIKSLLLHFV